MTSGRRTAATNDFRDQPAYPLTEAARYLKVPPATLRAWTLGRRYPTTKGKGNFRPLIRPASGKPPLAVVFNLIEAHVLRALRADHGVSVKALRKAVDYAERKLGIERLLLRRELCSDAGQVFLDRYGELIDLSASGQIAMKQVFQAHLKRVSWDDQRFPFRLHPFVALEGANQAMPIAIDSTIAFGRPVLISRGITTAWSSGTLNPGRKTAFS
jgi:hypothetical protein